MCDPNRRKSPSTGKEEGRNESKSYKNNKHHDGSDVKSDFYRPGIKRETLQSAGIKCVGANLAKDLCGLPAPGIFIPYYDFHGVPILDIDKPYGRLRLLNPIDDKKYHQQKYTGVHAYLPIGLNHCPSGRELYVIEGEFKAICLVEVGFSAVGIPGFYGHSKPGNKGLVPELETAISHLRPYRIIFCGDSDTLLNYQFIDSAIKFAGLVEHIPIFLARIPLNGPGKGADDCREVLGDKFPTWWNNKIQNALEICSKPKLGNLVIASLRQEEKAIAALNGADRDTAERRLVEMSAAIRSDPLSQSKVVRFAVDTLDLSCRAFQNAVKVCIEEKRLNNAAKEDPTKSDGKIIDLSEPAANWTRDIYDAIKDETFLYSGNLCRFYDERLHPQNAAEIVSFIDDPKRCNFMHSDNRGKLRKSRFTE